MITLVKNTLIDSMTDLVDAERKRTIQVAIHACRCEKIGNPDNADDETYNRAIDHCIEAILKVEVS